MLEFVPDPYPLRFASKEDADKAMSDLSHARDYSVPMFRKSSFDGEGEWNPDYFTAPFELRVMYDRETKKAFCSFEKNVEVHFTDIPPCC